MYIYIVEPFWFVEPFCQIQLWTLPGSLSDLFFICFEVQDTPWEPLASGLIFNVRKRCRSSHRGAKCPECSWLQAQLYTWIYTHRKRGRDYIHAYCLCMAACLCRACCDCGVCLLTAEDRTRTWQSPLISAIGGTPPMGMQTGRTLMHVHTVPGRASVKSIFKLV